jgi:hypothetical protein
MTDRSEQILLSTWVVLILVVVAAAFQDWTGFPVRRTVTIEKDAIDKDGASFEAEVDTFGELHGRARKFVRLFENGSPYRKSMSSQEHVATGAPGTWHFVGRTLYFNASDETSPLRNARTYTLSTPDGLSTKAQRLIQLIVVILSVVIWRHGPSRKCLAQVVSELRGRVAGIKWPEVLRQQPRQRIVLGGFVLAALWVILEAASLLSETPELAILRDDTGGFLTTALRYLETGSFELTWKRKFFYPGFLALVMQLGGSLNAVAAVQVALGYLTAVLIVLGTWLLADRKVWSLFLGLAFAHFFLQSPSTIYYGLSLMGEGLSPIFITLTVLGFIVFLQARDLKWVIGSWACMVLCAESLYYLKPNWGLGILFPFAAIFARRLLHSDFKLIPGGLVYGASCLAVLWAMQAINSAVEGPSKEKSSFLAQTLFIAHLKQLKPVLESDLKSGKAERPEVVQEMLDRYQEALQVTALNGHAGYKRIGFNPNLLMNGDRSLTKLPHFSKLTAAQQDEFMMGYFKKMVLHRPFAYAAKVIGMFNYLFEGQRIFPNHEEVEYWDLLQKSNENLASYGGTEGKAYLEAHRDSTEAYLKAPADVRTDLILMHEQRVFRTLDRLFLLAIFVLPLLTLVSGIVEHRRNGLSLSDPEMRRRIELALLVNGLLLLFFLVLGTNAAIYTLKVRRYTEFVLPISIFTLIAGLVFVAGEVKHLGPLVGTQIQRIRRRCCP